MPKLPTKSGSETLEVKLEVELEVELELGLEVRLELGLEVKLEVEVEFSLLPLFGIVPPLSSIPIASKKST